MGISIADRKKLWAKSGARCALCKTELIQQGGEDRHEFTIGQEAHIVGKREGSARFDASLSEAERNSENNFILLCPSHHVKIDKDEGSYTVEVLYKLKQEHESFIQDAIREQMPNVTYAELEVTVNYLVANVGLKDDDVITYIKPKDKIKRNSLSISIENLISTGMGRVKDVKSYMNTNPDINFADKLKFGLVTKYNEFKSGGLDADTIFLELLNYSSANSRDDRNRAAALSVIVYFFEACDIFEK